MDQKLKQELNNLLNEFKKCKSQNRFYTLIDSYYMLETIIKLLNLNIEIPKELEYEIDKINIDKIYGRQNINFNNNYIKMYDFNIKFSLLYKKLKKRYNKTYQTYNKKIDINNSINMVKEFLKYYDSDIESYFNDVIGSRFFITDKIHTGITSKTNDISSSYSFINPKYNIVDYFSIIHELIHNYINEKNKYMSENKKIVSNTNNLFETYPSFIEHVASHYLKQNSYLVDEINEYKSGIDITTIYFLEEFYNNLINNEYDDYLDNEAYSFGRVISYHFYEEYLKNKKKTKENILKFSTEDQYHNKEYMLNNYGLSQNKLLNPKVLTKYMDKHYK